jgi:hypothetical protein
MTYELVHFATVHKGDIFGFRHAGDPWQSLSELSRQRTALC